MKQKRPFDLWRQFWTWFAIRRRWQKVGLIIATALAGLLVLNAAVEHLWPPMQDPHYGVSFSIKYAQELGLDWQANFTALLDQLHFKRFRLMTYWDLTEPSPGHFDFSDLDWQFNEVAKRGGTVTLMIGYRQPRWPECHQPSWVTNPPYTDAWQEQLNRYLQKVVEHYKSNPILQSYQLENEAVNNWFGTCPHGLPRPGLINEFNLVKKLDPKHPVWMSLSDEHGFPGGQPVPDKYGYSVYRIVWNDKGPLHFYITYPTPAWYHRARALFIRWFKHRDVFVHELQMEPWGPIPTKNMTIAEQNQSMSVKQMGKNLVFVRKIDKNDIYMWGGEWWYWRMTKLNDPGPWNRVRQELQTFPY